MPRLPRISLAFVPLMAGAALATATASAEPCAPPAGRYDYAIDVSGLGRVGALTGIVRRNGGETTIAADTEIVVRMAGIVVHRYAESRRTVYRDGRLASYSAEIRSNGSVEKVRVVRGPQRLEATYKGEASSLPADAVPGFPWMRCFADQPAAFTLRSARVRRVEVSGRLPMSVRIGARDLPAHEVRFASPKGWVTWFGDDGTMLRHSFDNSGRRVTLTRLPAKK